ncbi:MAG: ATP-dependent helicase [Candidatus Nealsonbacteria bacterium]|nr:MAG: ATP-dependent helicase [Candidatus Nealsonbacteria bacterium]
MIEIKEPLNSYKEFPGPILLLAGPGTGKTYQLALRIKFLIEEKKVNPNEITVITFTKSATRNMQERLAEKDINLDKSKYPEIISTTHHLGNMIIGSSCRRFDLPEKYKILIEKSPKRVLLRDATNLAGYDRDNWKHTEDCRLKGRCNKAERDKCKICDEYKKILRKCTRVDYDDLILLACEALRGDKDLRNQWKQRTKFLLVDEYQDINKAQFELIQLLSKNQEEGLFVVGDDEQSIYSFRGGSTEFIRNFEKDFPKNPKIGRLSISWRCPKHILLGAKSMINKFYKNAVIKPKPKFSEKIKINNKIIFCEVPTAKKEAQIIAAISQEKIKTNTIKIIIPNKMYLPVLKEEFQKRGLEYKYKFNISDQGLVRFTVLTDWINNPNDNIALRYLIDLIIENYDGFTKKINEEKCGIILKRDRASNLIAQLWKKVERKKSLYKILIEESQNSEFLKELNNNLNILKELIKNRGTKKTGLLDFLATSGLFVAPGKNPLELVSEIKEWINELSGSNTISSYNPITIYNMPSCKGLEADIIFVIGLSKELFPDSNNNIEEKSRLFYVAMTRAKKELYLFSSRTRSSKITFKKASYQLKPSPFISAISKDNIETRIIYPRKKPRKQFIKRN